MDQLHIDHQRCPVDLQIKPIEIDARAEQRGLWADDSAEPEQVASSQSVMPIRRWATAKPAAKRSSLLSLVNRVSAPLRRFNPLGCN